MRTTIEDQLNMIAEGKDDYENVVGKVINNIQQKYLNFIKNIDAMDSEFQCSFTYFIPNKKLFSRYILIFYHIIYYLLVLIIKICMIKSASILFLDKTFFY